MSSRSLTGLDLTGLAVSCPDTIESTRKPDQTTHKHTFVECAYHMCVRVVVCVCVQGAKSQAKGPKANKEQEERSSRKLTSHFIPPSPSLSLSLSLLGQTVGSREKVEVKIKG